MFPLKNKTQQDKNINTDSFPRKGSGKIPEVSGAVTSEGRNLVFAVHACGFYSRPRACHGRVLCVFCQSAVTWGRSELAVESAVLI